MRLMQHKREAWWFYRYLSIFYDKLVNPLFWTKWMRDQSLSIGDLDAPGIQVVDVGAGTGFTTEGIVKHVSPGQVTMVDQSPHRLSHAKRKLSLRGVTFQIGDAEDIPFPNDHFDRYVSAGSIEYWPDPQKGIMESYRVIKPGGKALMIGPLDPPSPIASFIANTWMLFPKKQEYIEWYEKAGFTDIEIKYTAPHWVDEKDEYCIAIVGTKPKAGDSPYRSKHVHTESSADNHGGVIRTVNLLVRVLAGSVAGFLFIPIALVGYIRHAFDSQSHLPPEYRESLNAYQIAVLSLIAVLIVWWIR